MKLFALIFFSTALAATGDTRSSLQPSSIARRGLFLPNFAGCDSALNPSAGAPKATESLPAPTWQAGLSARSSDAADQAAKAAGRRKISHGWLPVSKGAANASNVKARDDARTQPAMAVSAGQLFHRGT